MPGSIGIGGPQQRHIDEAAVERKYVHLKWTVARLAREYRASRERIEAILAGRGVELRAARELDKDAVLAAYARHRTIQYVADAMGAGAERIRAILDEEGVPHADVVRVQGFSNVERRQAARKRRLADEPSPADLLLPAQAAAVAGVSVRTLAAAARDGQISYMRTGSGQRRYVRRDAEDLGRRLHRRPP